MGASEPSPLPFSPWHCSQLSTYIALAAASEASVAGRGFLTFFASAGTGQRSLPGANAQAAQARPNPKNATLRQIADRSVIVAPRSCVSLPLLHCALYATAPRRA